MTHDPRPAIWKLFIAGGLLTLLLGCATYYHQADLPLNLLAKRQIPSAEYWLGTDNLGRDLLIRCLQGVYTSWQIGLIASLIGQSWRYSSALKYCESKKVTSFAWPPSWVTVVGIFCAFTIYRYCCHKSSWGSC